MKDLSSYFGDDGDALHMEFAFLLNQSLWLSLGRGEAEPLEQKIGGLPVVPHDNAWATFLRNHDELSLDQLTVSQRDEVFAAFRAKRGHAALRTRPAAPGRDDARRRRRAAADGMEPDVLAARDAGRVHGRRDRDRGAAVREGRMSVRVPMQWSRPLPPPRRPSSADSPGSLLAFLAA